MKKQMEEFSKQANKRSDKLMDYFLACFFITGLLLSFYYNTWLIGTGVGGLSLIAYYSAKFALPGSDLYQYVLSAVIGIFMTQFIYQTHGMFEMHFFAFIGSALMITYRNWKLQIPLAAVVILHHVAFGYLQFIGFDKIYFTQLEYMTIQTFAIYGMLTLTIFAICGLWSYNFKRASEDQIRKSFEIGKLQEAYVQKETLAYMSDELRASNERLLEANFELRIIFNTIEEVLFSMDLVNCRLIHISVACTKIYGYTPIEFIVDNDLWVKVIHPHDKHIVKGNHELLKEGKTVLNQYRIINKDKTIHWVETKIIPTLDAENKLIRIDGISADITERVKLENKLTNEKRLKQQQLTAAALTAQENERSFLGEELHDNINPILATAKLYLECAIRDENKRESLLKDSKDFITTAMKEMRKLSRSLIPPSLGEVRLVDAISDMCENIRRVNDVRFITQWQSLDENVLNDKLKLTIYRILQEQLNNILKYAKATAVTISLSQQEGVLEIIIADDGVGFDVTKKRNGVGLQNIISRTELLNGKADIISEPGKGCSLFLHFNLDAGVSSIKTKIRA